MRPKSAEIIAHIQMEYRRIIVFVQNMLLICMKIWRHLKKIWRQNLGQNLDKFRTEYIIPMSPLKVVQHLSQICPK